MKPIRYTGLLLLLFAASCSIQKHLPPGTQLYRGAKFDIQKDSLNRTRVRTIRKQLTAISIPKPNTAIFGFPYRVWLWYLFGEPHKESGFRYWLRYRIGQEPVLNTAADTKANAENFTNYLINKGYFNSRAQGDTSVKGYKMYANYRVKLGMPYFVRGVDWIIDTLSEIGRDISRIPDRNVLIKPGQQFDLDNVKAERTRVDGMLKNRGYYYFSPDHIKAWIDSTNRDNTVNVHFKLKDDVPVAAVMPQRISSITLFPNYSLIFPPPDTARSGMRIVNGIHIRDTVRYLNDATLTRSVTYKPNSLYNLRQQNRTLNRFINTGVFKFVKNRYEVNGDTLLPRWLDVYYYLTPLPKKTIQAEVGAFTKTNSFTGAQASVTWKNRNAFKGAEQLLVKFYGSFESAGTDSLRRNNNFRLGTEFSLVLPRFVTPFRVRDSFAFPPKTSFSLGYEWMRKQALYTKNYFRFQYDLAWREANNKQHLFAPVSITHTITSAFSPEYKTLIDQIPGLKISNLPELIMGSFYTYTYTTRNINAPRNFYLRANIDAAGNILGALNKAKQPYTGKFLGAYYAQYVKMDADMHYSIRFGKESRWVNRVVVGAGFPYGNSLFLPFVKQFIIGGANSLRGFQVRQLGPGRVKTTPQQQLYYPQVGGDYKLELNTELRFPVFGKLKGAVFVDAGNVWTRDAILYGNDAKFTAQFLNDLAVDAGLGARVDLSFLIIRLDLGLPLRVPYRPRGQEWDFGNSFRNIVYNIAIGYPF
ncbi:translocation and assembly module lipoprotein TamL [Sediminibacterium soli]|uniref:translocation and assembly module lipoprotein TamL n=1 Tax=Sediminibacterium soli TaxID=2698829 RepID=UPI00137AAFFD|nr:BamA/TamA family outer membrane protein [Sediminibacterium soli]NCI45892.1 BamA/TamA family outer membrane protein [Sediminibacterium soli]